MPPILTNNANEGSVEIFWDYTPADFFEEKVTFESENHSFEIEAGRIITRLPASFYDSRPDLEESLRREVRFFILGAQPYRRKEFAFTRGGTNRTSPDGKRRISRWGPLFRVTVLPPVDDHVYRDDRGVMHDPQRERIDAMKNLGKLSARYAPADPIVRRILESFDASIQYPENEFVYLYEIWDALQTKFQGDRKARRALGISKPDRSRLTNLANNEPLNQGRHRGQFAEMLRNATTEELDEARKIASDFIEKYLNYLDGKS